jgi:hypothetical protein
MFAIVVGGSSVTAWTVLLAAGFPVVAGLLAYTARSLLQNTTLTRELERRLGRVEDELWPRPVGAAIPSYRRDVVRGPQRMDGATMAATHGEG